MPTPKRTLIRQAVLAELQTVKVELGVANIFSNRIEQYSTKHLPAISVYFPNEQPTPRDVGSSSYRRELTLRLDVVVTGTSSIEDTLELFQERIEDLLINNGLAGLVQGVQLESSNSELIVSDSSDLFGKLEINFTIHYSK